MEIGRVRLIQFETYIDRRGELNTMEANKQIPFDIKRVFYIHGTQYERGGHAHKKCQQVLIALNEVVHVWIGAFEYVLSSPRFGLYVPTNYKIRMVFESGAILLVLASERYDPDDYIQ
jgi:hypothetical protein